MFSKLLFVASFSELFIAIQYAVLCRSLRTFFVSLYIYICDVEEFHGLTYIWKSR